MLIGFRAGVGPSGRSGVYRAFGATYLQDIGPNARVVRIRVPAILLDAVKRALERLPHVSFVEKNYLFAPTLLPNDPEYAGQWHLPQILAPQAWDMTQGSAAAVIAILDSGIDATHPDFAGKLVAGYNTYGNSADTSDVYGHGTEVAGVAAASTNNGQGVAGVAGAAPLMPVRVTDNLGRATSASIANGIMWAADHGARVANLSFGGVAGNLTIGTAAQYAYNHGMLVVAASGNCACVDPTPETPYILSVSATDESDDLAGFSTTGPFVDLSAPGTNILTTVKGGLYLADSGTSLASPVVAGVAAMMIAAKPSLTPALTTQLLEATAVDLGGAGYDQTFGYGRVNAASAVAAAFNYTPPVDTTPPNVEMTAPLSGASVSATAVVDVAASDDVGVMKVDLYVDGVFFATDTLSPFSFAWDTSALSDGAHTLQVVAADAAGNSTSAAPVSVTVSNAPPDTTPPTVSISSPVGGATVSGTATVSVNASDNVGVAKVAFYVDGALLGTDTTAPYAIAWNTTGSSNGAHTLLGVATDAAGNAKSASVSVTVSNTPPDTKPPTVAITSPANGATVSGTATVSASASDNVAVAKVALYIDGALYATDTTAPYAIAWNTTQSTNGTHALVMTATDTAGNTASATRSVTVSNNQAPVAVNDAYTAPYRAATSYTAQVYAVLANDSDADGTLKASTVAIVAAPNKGGTVSVNNSGTVTYSPKKGYRGSETFTYRVKDNLGAWSNTATVTVTVQ
ncbi:MAG: Ig-like domain-containing protein [Burkholderiales bacterium]